jgi:hypothetical protein
VPRYERTRRVKIVEELQTSSELLLADPRAAIDSGWLGMSLKLAKP